MHQAVQSNRINSCDVRKSMAERLSCRTASGASRPNGSKTPGIVSMQADIASSKPGNEFILDLKKIIYVWQQRNKETMSKRKGYVIEKIADMDNLIDADKKAQAGGKAKKSRYIRRHNANKDRELKNLQEMILGLRPWPEITYSPMTVKNDHGKDRDVARQHFYPWKILQHAIMNVIGDDVYKNLIADSFACVPGKGLHYGVKRLRMMLRRYPEYRYFWKTDYKKYYQSIPHEVTRMNLERRFKDKRFIELMETTILSYTPDEDIIKQLEDAAEKTEKRFANRGKYKSATG